MAYNTIFQRLMNHFPELKHLQLGNSFTQSSPNDELGSPFQPNTFEMNGVMGENYEDAYFQHHHSSVIKQESPWGSEDKASSISTPFTIRKGGETLPDTPCSNFDHQSQGYGDSAPSLRSVSSLTNLSSNGSRGGRKIVKPLVATVYWEEEKSVCYQVKANGIVVSRKESDNYVNGTKLLNVAGMSRGRRDGILKIEKGRRVIRNGSMNLKGVWIPFDRASEIARNEGIKDLLFPLFVDDIGKFYKEKGQGLCEELDGDDDSHENSVA